MEPVFSKDDLKMLIKSTGLTVLNMIYLDDENSDKYLSLQRKLKLMLKELK